MPERVVRVRAASRLHFGMFSFGHPAVRQFGGVGVMIAPPELELAVSASPTIEIFGPMAERARLVVQQLEQRGWFPSSERCRIEIVAAPAPHVGLGSGTQLALAIATGIDALVDSSHSLEATVRAVGRGRRSSIGTHGFFSGGLVIDPGKLQANEIPEPIVRVGLPEAWRFVLMRSTDAAGLSGEAEQRAFGALPAVPIDRTAQLCQRALLELAPAAVTAEFPAFSEALGAFGRLAGECFASQQGGRYASVAALPLLDAAERLGVQGVAQSSWGPTVAALLPDAASAEHFAAAVEGKIGHERVLTEVAAPVNHGATVE
ncbi:MAG TPA: hypothetical protein VHZ24_01895 [Pirellulales bacterium]|jgi:beta-RFAP synthase|nr:hypothetical protein [Pirellulales bacterium]